MTRQDRTSRRLTAEDWADAALRAIGEGGLSSVAVEPLALKLGTTKGSFYHHFRNRRSLIEAALETWERDHTDAVIAHVSTIANEAGDPKEHLRELFTLIVEYSLNDHIEIGLLSSADDAAVAAVLERVTQRRVEHVAAMYERMGDDATTAWQRAALAVSVYLGHLQLIRISRGLLPTQSPEWKCHVEHVVSTLLAEG
ncbi:TetR/AcrR family transcriptional regulator [Natronoglycomyces albus]|uniref:TetR/AcrR family transcriptional regulator n=1 Tax=Natronoglycomyces albus TaxID=2811108 RepID=A0A895XVW1_9ACTN|nr:TetR/AcrR family transcriptional regulator [Natronoglycomyces albus]QSB06360.1 TetR/AcrR family transcriptional regulator [Natronoglycomyces albus]